MSYNRPRRIRKHWGAIFETRAIAATHDPPGRRQRNRIGRRLLIAAPGLLPAVAFAHVKWFVNYDLLSPPRPVLSVLSGSYFVLFSLFVATLIFVVSLLDSHLAQRKPFLDGRARALVERVSKQFPLLLRWGVSAFFTAVFVYGCLYDWMILTPELRTHSGWICWIQLAIARNGQNAHETLATIPRFKSFKSQIPIMAYAQSWPTPVQKTNRIMFLTCSSSGAQMAAAIPINRMPPSQHWMMSHKSARPSSRTNSCRVRGRKDS